MKDWLPDNWKQDEIGESAQRSAEAVVHRVIRHRKAVIALRWTAATVVLMVAAFLLAPKLDHQHGPPPGKQIAQRVPAAAPDTGRAEAPHALGTQGKAADGTSLAHPVDVQVAKANRGVLLTWKGNPQREYVVYRCTSPRFDACSTVGVVTGTRWLDRSPSPYPVVFYRVEARKGA